MLGHDIALSSDGGVLRLYTVLIKHPKKATLLKHLHFNSKTGFTVLLKELLGIAVTHNIESLTGNLFDEQFFDTLIDIVKTSPIKFDKLKTLTVSPDIGRRYRELSLQFVDSVEIMEADFERIDWDYVAQLTQFKKVKTFALKGVFHNFDILEQVLSNCPPKCRI